MRNASVSNVVNRSIENKKPDDLVIIGGARADECEVEEARESKGHNNTTDPASLDLAMTGVIGGGDAVCNLSPPSQYT